MKYLFLSLALCLGFSLVQAQNFDFNSYKYRYQRYRGLTSTLNLAGNNDILKSVMTDNFGPADRVNNRSYSPAISFNSLLGNNYFHYISTDRWQQSLNLNLNYRVGIYATNSKSDIVYPAISYNNNSINRNYQSDLYLSLNSENRRYYTGKRFLLIGIKGYYDLSAQRNNYRSSSNNVMGRSGYDKNLDFQSNTDIRIGGGKGRLEYVTDAVMAYFLLRDLSKKAQIGEVRLLKSMLTISKILSDQTQK